MSTQTAQLLDDLRSYMNDARAMCDRGEFMALDGLDGRVKTICDTIGALPVAEARGYADELDAIGKDLEALQDYFMEKRAALGEELADTSKHHKAAKAYTQSEFSAPKEG